MDIKLNNPLIRGGLATGAFWLIGVFSFLIFRTEFNYQPTFEYIAFYLSLPVIFIIFSGVIKEISFSGGKMKFNNMVIEDFLKKENVDELSAVDDIAILDYEVGEQKPQAFQRNLGMSVAKSGAKKAALDTLKFEINQAPQRDILMIYTDSEKKLVAWIRHDHLVIKLIQTTIEKVAEELDEIYNQKHSNSFRPFGFSKLSIETTAKVGEALAKMIRHTSDYIVVTKNKVPVYALSYNTLTGLLLLESVK